MNTILNTSDLYLNLLEESEINDDKNLEINTHDHDGTNTMYIVLATEKERDSINPYDDIDYHLFNKGKKPVKLDNEFINDFGGLK